MVRMCSSWNAHALLIQVEIVVTTLEDSLAISLKSLTYDPAILLLGVHQREMKTHVYTKTCT